MDKRKSQSLAILILAFMLVTLLIAYLMFLSPSFKNKENQQNRVHSLRFEGELLLVAIDKKQEQSKLSDDLQQALPLWDNTEQLVVSMKKIGQATSAQLNSVSFSISDSNQLHVVAGSEASLHPTVKEVRTQVVLEGSTSQIRSWMVQLQQLERLVVINSVRYNTALGGTTAAEITFTSYFDPSYAFLLDNPITPLRAE